MKLIFYSPVSNGTEESLKRTIEPKVAEKGDVQTCRSIDALALRLRQPADKPIVAVLLASTRDELLQLVSIHDLLDSAAIILVLPDRQEDTIRTGHRLRPRFLSYMDGDHNEVSAVLEKMLRTLRRETEALGNAGLEIEGQRHPWSGRSTQ